MSRVLSSALLLASATFGLAQSTKPQLWNVGEVEAPHSGLTQFDVLVAGRTLEVRRPDDVRVFRRDAGFCSVLIQNVEILTVIKGNGLRSHQVIPVLVIPEISDVADGQGNPPPGWTYPQALQFHRVTGDFPDGVHLRRARAFEEGERRVFALFKPQFRDNEEGEWLVWSGGDLLQSIDNLYALTLSWPLLEDGQDVEALVRYVQIDAMEGMDERIRSLAEHSLAVLRDPDSTSAVARAAVLDLRRLFDNSKWPPVRTILEDGRIADMRERYTAEYLTDTEMGELVDRALNPKTPLWLRRDLVWMLATLLPAEAWRPYRVDPKRFLDLVMDRSQHFDLRRAAVALLDHVEDERVTRTFRELLSKGNEEDRRLLAMTKEAFQERERKQRDGKP